LDAPLDFLLTDQPTDVFRRLAGVDARQHFGAGHPEPRFGLILTIDGANLRRVLRADDDGNALGAAQLKEGGELLDRRKLREFVEEQPDSPLHASGQSRTADSGGEETQHAADPDAGEFGIAGIMLENQRATRRRIVQPATNGKAASRRIGPSLRQDGDDPHMGLKGRENAERRPAVGLIEQTQSIRVMVLGMPRQHLHVGGDFRFEFGPTPTAALGHLKMDDAGDEDFLSGLRPHRIGARRNEASGQLAGILLDAAICGHVPDQGPPVMRRDEKRFRLGGKASHHVALGVQHQEAIIA
jgi:hypothetical protein